MSPWRRPPDVGDLVEVIDGPYAGRFGRVRAVDAARRAAWVALTFDGATTVVELSFAQVARLETLARNADAR
jgi:transcription antitermination factor NusG